MNLYYLPLAILPLSRGTEQDQPLILNPLLSFEQELDLLTRSLTFHHPPKHLKVRDAARLMIVHRF